MAFIKQPAIFAENAIRPIDGNLRNLHMTNISALINTIRTIAGSATLEAITIHTPAMAVMNTQKKMFAKSIVSMAFMITGIVPCAMEAVMNMRRREIGKG